MQIDFAWRQRVRYSLYARAAPSLRSSTVPRLTMMCMWGGKFWRIGEAARSYSSIELEAVRVGGAAWRFPGILQKGIEDAILFVTTRSYCGLGLR